MFRKVNLRGRLRPARKPGRKCDKCGLMSNVLSLYWDFILPGRYHRRCLPRYYKDGSVEFGLHR